MSKTFKQLDFKNFVFQNFRNDNMTKILFLQTTNFQFASFTNFLVGRFFA